MPEDGTQKQICCLKKYREDGDVHFGDGPKWFKWFVGYEGGQREDWVKRYHSSNQTYPESSSTTSK